jgi:hypothetical protein
VNDYVVRVTITAVELRKTRVGDAGGETVVVANRDVEKKWTKRRDDAARAGS